MGNRFEDILSSLHSEVNKHLGTLHSLHHKQQILNIQLVTGQFIDKIQCSTHHDELQEMMDTILDDLEGSDLQPIIRVFTEFLKLEVTDGCETYFSPLQSHIKTYLKLLNKETTNFKDQIQFTDLSAIDTTKAYEMIIDPLSNQKRLEIMMAIHNKHTRFKDLEEVLNLQAGHLIYHLNPLKGSNYVSQDQHKNYMLTEKGKTILEMLKYIYEMYPE